MAAFSVPMDHDVESFIHEKCIPNDARSFVLIDSLVCKDEIITYYEQREFEKIGKTGDLNQMIIML